MKKCHWCGKTKNLKSATCEGGDIDCLNSGYHDTSTCVTCFIDMLGCNDCEQIIGECIKEIGTEYECPNAKENKSIIDNWDSLDYKYKERKIKQKIKVTHRK